VLGAVLVRAANDGERVVRIHLVLDETCAGRAIDLDFDLDLDREENAPPKSISDLNDWLTERLVADDRYVDLVLDRRDISIRRPPVATQLVK
jgi:hypothetical protein